jgi:hypothetical protein
MKLRLTIIPLLLVLLTTASTMGIVCDLKCSMPHHDHHQVMGDVGGRTASSSMDMPGMSDDEMQAMPMTSQGTAPTELSASLACKSPCSIDSSWVDGKKSFGHELVAVMTQIGVPVPLPVTTTVSIALSSRPPPRTYRAPTILRI